MALAPVYSGANQETVAEALPALAITPLTRLGEAGAAALAPSLVATTKIPVIRRTLDKPAIVLFSFVRETIFLIWTMSVARLCSYLT